MGGGHEPLSATLLGSPPPSELSLCAEVEGVLGKPKDPLTDDHAFCQSQSVLKAVEHDSLQRSNTEPVITHV